jgi:hypothetical protein
MANNQSSDGLGINAILFLIFMVLKLTKFIDWSWWWVTSPLWITVILYGVVVLYLIVTKKI